MAVVAMTAVFAVIAAVLALGWINRPFMGVLVDHTLTVNAGTPNGQTEWAGREAGLRPGDVLRTVTVGDETYDAERAYSEILPDLDTDQVISVTFDRPANGSETTLTDGSVCDASSTCTTTFTLTSFPVVDLFALFLTPFLSGLITLIIAAATIRAWPSNKSAFIGTITISMIAMYMITIFDAGTTHTISPVWLTSAVLLAGAVIALGISFPNPIPPVAQRPQLIFLPAILSVLGAVGLVTLYLTEEAGNANRAGQLSGVLILVSLAILGALMTFYQRQFASGVRARQQANTIIMGLALALVPAVVWSLSQLLRAISADLALDSFTIELTTPFMIVAAFSVFFAITQTNRYDSDRVLSQGITYSVMLLALIFGYFLLVLGGSLFATDVIAIDNPLILVITIFVVAVLFVPVRTRLQNTIDGIYYKKRYDYQGILEDFGQDLITMTDVDEMIDLFRSKLQATVEPANTLIFLLDRNNGDYIAYGKNGPETDIFFGQDSGVRQLLQNSDTMVYLQPGTPWVPELHIDRPRLQILRVMILAGMPGREELNGFICLTPPKSGENRYTFEELRFINNMIGQLAVSIERAIVITSLESRVDELNVLSSVGQAVNFTIEINDLLELISVQTLRLIPSPYFYIVLLEPSTNQLYFAFFLENDVREPRYEGKKWPIGNDLFSEVITKSQSIQVDNYEQTMKQRNYHFGFENQEAHAWMGVPLISGPSTLGVIALAEADPTKKFTQDQLRIFNNIGSLAATSIEKANLFTEANSRARQLTALNDISRQLVETEGDIEKLLELITQSAVEILNAEAGSLLITTEDGTESLEFRASIGGTGDQLIGTILPKGHGLVGQVAESGKPIISNDASADERWEGEIVAGEFNTASILAVPLIAKNRVVGVLEVINKKDGTIYVEDDTSLLTAFASQAAIAYENARLRQQTGVQLEQRVRELEALERIDRELNQALEIETVADITVTWAIRNSNARAGMLGVLVDNQTTLVIVAQAGYSLDDMPEGTDNRIIPTNKGIVSRVIRTRRPEVQPDVAIDPDYIPSLRNSLSQITVPMMAADEINAILILETDNEPRLNLLDLDWVQRLAEHASIAIANAQLYAELTRAAETKSEFVAFAAHELKNPLTSVKGYASTLRSPMASAMNADQIKEFAGIIQTNADRMQNIIDDLKDIAASDADQLKINLEPINLHNIVIDTLIPYQKQIEEKEQTLVNAVPEDAPLLLADPKRLIQVMTNFISNAHKYSPPEATITISAELIERYISRQTGRNIGPMMLVSISDTGIGMSDEDLNRIFKEDYFRSDNDLARQQKGTGLGMMITQRIIEGHQGEVWVESELGEGSHFKFVIPLAPNEEEEPATTPEPEGASD